MTQDVDILSGYTYVITKVKEAQLHNAIDILKLVMVEVEKLQKLSGTEKKQLVVALVTKLANGEDGIRGTNDDLLTASAVKGLKALIEDDLLANTIDIVVDATKGKLDINKVTKCTSKLFGCITGGSSNVKYTI